jgi:hypothetical protein
MFSVYCGKRLSRKAVHNWVKKRDKRFADNDEFETEAQKRLRQQPKDFCAAGFDALVKRWDKCLWRICREINVFPGSNTTFYGKLKIYSL